MAKAKVKRPTSQKMPRASASLSPAVYEILEQIAREKKVSLSWVLRDAAENYIADRWPLFGKNLIGGDAQK
jgi:metal-responsive CopG/Arc/MetJ family transcriptional regulator